MKKMLFLLLFPALIFAQKKDDVIKKLAESTCTCAQQKAQITQAEIGFCLISALSELSDKEKKVIGYSEDDLSASIEKVAENIGIKMAVTCPAVFTKMIAEEDTATATETATETPNPVFTGSFESISSNEFKTITLISDSNEKKTFIWLFPFDGDSMFIKNKIGKGDKLEIEYREQEFFDPKTNAYRTYNEISSVKLL
ncbi:MAG: hypothetical protein PSV16_01155 [Flavobacterium sp.]|nr:hypothetical protein [Flavobacterium sp.]